MSINGGAPRTIKGYAAFAKDEELVPWGHSDVHTLDEGWGPTKYPIIVGHEIVGLVTAVGPHVKHLTVGDRVGNSTHPEGHIAYGGYAEAVRVPAEYAFKIPDELPSDVAAPLLCAGVTVFAPLKRHWTPNARVGVVGIGGLGHLAIQFAHALGATEVVALSTSDRKRKDAEALGASKFVTLKAPEDYAAHASSLDLIICTASSVLMNYDLYLSLLDVGGKFVVVGLPEDSVQINFASLILRQRSIVGSMIGARADIEEMLEFAAKKKVHPWIEKVPMAEVNTAIARLRKGDVSYRFVLEN
ncbi:chlorophyll synthesis pathway, bchC [Allomyces macrogynus ATCC 38327]|uniref:Chlorophyll synthesis pathway, bchC n=1 Tax=Allomyces macrogynus (strain ATCC 38327) TaxID=578462 RepID=A0A0L0SKD5_ALLM3|nr:chlorophyll synthesis pathway, bchC [Allomyces macrogynus ATCC 38327]|eukprot:KNE62870.1 chlorophyll synthesis pathway, bchC [Allomyces macrogynus ATCC 38327]